MPAKDQVWYQSLPTSSGSETTVQDKIDLGSTTNNFTAQFDQFMPQDRVQEMADPEKQQEEAEEEAKSDLETQEDEESRYRLV